MERIERKQIEEATQLSLLDVEISYGELRAPASRASFSTLAVEATLFRGVEAVLASHTHPPPSPTVETSLLESLRVLYTISTTTSTIVIGASEAPSPMPDSVA